MIRVNLLGVEQASVNQASRKLIQKQRARRHYEANKAAYIERADKWRENHLEVVRENARRSKADRLADWKKNNPEKMSEYRISGLAGKYGLTKDEYRALLTEQGGVCAVCGSLPPVEGPRKRLHLDHCHQTGKVRGFLCQSCNHAIGHAKDDPDLLRKLASYLESRRE